MTEREREREREREFSRYIGIGFNPFCFSPITLRPFAKRLLSEKTTLLEGAEEYALDGMKRRMIRLAKSGLLPTILGQDVSGVFLQPYRLVYYCLGVGSSW